MDGNVEISGDVSISGQDVNVSVVCDEIVLDASQVDICGNLTVNDIIPSETDTYSLGTPDMRFKEIHLSDGTVHTGETSYGQHAITDTSTDDEGSNTFGIFYDNIDILLGDSDATTTALDGSTQEWHHSGLLPKQKVS